MRSFSELLRHSPARKAAAVGLPNSCLHTVQPGQWQPWLTFPLRGLILAKQGYTLPLQGFKLPKQGLNQSQQGLIGPK